MHVIDSAKGRIVAVTMAAAALAQVFPNAQAVERPTVTAAKTGEVKEPKQPKKTKKSKKKVAGTERKEKEPVEIVLEEAQAQLGKPYRWAAEGPSSFDCSGFTKYVWGKAGVGLPHNSRAQMGATRRIGLDEAEAGDLIFSPGHVGLYIGDGKMIHSPRSGRHVEIAPLHSRAYAAGRPKG